jgi:hypothetical protein
VIRRILRHADQAVTMEIYASLYTSLIRSRWANPEELARLPY